jgi:hypothetical protein
VAGGFGCFALAPVCFLVVANGLGRAPSLHIAIAALAVGLALCLGVAVATTSEGNGYLLSYLRATGPAGILVSGLAYIGWLTIAALAVARAKRVSRHGT